MKFRHRTITTLVVTPKDRILRGLTTLIDALTDVPIAQSDAQLPAIVALRDASYSWASPKEKPYPSVPIPRPTPVQTIRAIKILERKTKKTPITRQPTPRVPIEPALCYTATRRKIQKHLPEPPPRVIPKETPPTVQPIAHRKRSHTLNKQPPIALCTRAQLRQAFRVTPYQATQRYPLKALLAFCYTPIKDLAMPILKYETG